MASAIKLQQIPAIFFPERWSILRPRLGNDLTALYCFNAPYPEPADPSDLFYANGRSDEEATELYSIGRSVVKDCRKLFLDRKLVATGIQSDGKRARIPADAWLDLWPLFVTGRANGPGITFNDVNVRAMSAYRLEQDCVAWLKTCPNLTSKKCALYEQAKLKLGGKLSHRIFNAAYKQVLGRTRGRPPKA